MVERVVGRQESRGNGRGCLEGHCFRLEYDKFSFDSYETAETSQCQCSNYLIAYLEVRNVLTDCCYFPGTLETKRDVGGRFDPKSFSMFLEHAQSMEDVSEVESSGPDLNLHFVRAWFTACHRLEGQII